MKKKSGTIIFPILVVMMSLVVGLSNNEKIRDYLINQEIKEEVLYNIFNIPQYNGKPYVYINGNIPNFSKDDYITKSFEQYSKTFSPNVTSLE